MNLMRRTFPSTDIVLDLCGFAVVQLACPDALSNPVNRTCKSYAVLNRPYWLLYFAGIVGEAALLVIFQLALCLHLVRFHRQALRGRVLPDVLSELAQLSANTGINDQMVGESAGVSRGAAVINADGDLVEMHARIVDIM